MTKHWDNLIITDRFNITGRGMVLIIDFISSGLCSEIWVKELPLKIDVGDTILYEGVTYDIRAIDVSRNTFNGYLMTKIGVLV
jgi:hypothetical protein